MDCLVCHEDIIKTGYAASLPCGHVFHGICIYRWVKDQETCPVCRCTLTKERISPLFLSNNSNHDESYKYTVKEDLDKEQIPVYSISVQIDQQQSHPCEISRNHSDSEDRTKITVCSLVIFIMCLFAIVILISILSIKNKF